MDGSSPLEMQFKQLDADGDGKLNVDEAYQLLKLVGKNIYKGSVASAAKLFNMTEEQNNLMNFSQFKQFYDSLQNPLKHDIWKSKYKILRVIQQIKTHSINKEESTAAPGAKPAPPQDSGPFKGDIEVTVGPTNQNYNSCIQLNLEKTPKAQSKPFIKIVFQQSSNQKAKQLEQKFKLLQTNVFDLIKSSQPGTSEVLDHIHILTNVNQNKLNVFVTNSNQPLTELGNLTASFLDRVLGAQFSAKLNLKFEFNLDPNNFLDKQSNYSFYHALTKNYHLKMVWDACDFKQASKDLFKLLEAFDQFKYDKMDPISLALIGVLHADICQVNLVFDNAEFDYAQQQTKFQILEALKQLNTLLSQEQNMNLGIFQAIGSFQNKINIQASIGDWKANLRLSIKDIKQLFKKQEIVQDGQNYPLPQQNVQLSLQPLPKVASFKQLSKSSSQSSIKLVNTKLKQQEALSPKKQANEQKSLDDDSDE